VSVIVGACGSFIHFQEAATRAARVPVFLSIMLEVPLLLRALPAQSKLGIIFASAATFSPRVCDQSGISDTSRIIALGADEIEAFRPILSQSGVLDSLAHNRAKSINRRVVASVQRLTSLCGRYPVGDKPAGFRYGIADRAPARIGGSPNLYGRTTGMSNCCRKPWHARGGSVSMSARSESTESSR
jgi:hypothetical protein